jgi:hypothetical protein
MGYNRETEERDFASAKKLRRHQANDPCYVSHTTGLATLDVTFS